MAIVKPVIQYNLGYDVYTAQVMASCLEPFVYQNETYGFMPNNLPALTIGGLLMRLSRLSLLGELISTKQKEGLNTAQQQVDNVKQKWFVIYTNRINHELTIHLNELDQFLNECRQDLDECRELYPSLIEKRVMAQILGEEARALQTLTPDTDDRLRDIDGRLKGYFKPGPFIWDQRLQPAYPQDRYWFLYVSL